MSNGEVKSSTDQAASSVSNESDVYDRQIRLWGADAQSKMSSAKVLYVHISGVSSEILKNLVLAGIRAAICDGRPYPDALSETPSSFLPPSERVFNNGNGENDDKVETVNRSGDNDGESVNAKRSRRMSVARAMAPHVMELNPLLDECEIDETIPLSSIPSEYFAKFDIVVASQIGIDDAVRIAKATTTCSDNGATNGGKRHCGKFILVHCFGMYGCAMLDLGEGHEFRRETGKDKLSDLETLKPYIPLEKMLRDVTLGHATDRWHKNGPPKVWAMYRSILHYHEVHNNWPDGEHSKAFVQTTQKYLESSDSGVMNGDYLGGSDDLEHLAVIATAEISPVCSVLGGVLGNEIIKAISGKGEPANNILLFDGRDGGCMNFTLKK